jgi:hypothetical protein
LFVRDQKLWLVDVDRGAPTAIAGPLGPLRDGSGHLTGVEDGNRLFMAAP